MPLLLGRRSLEKNLIRQRGEIMRDNEMGWDKIQFLQYIEE
jgi:hypothetical protein